MVMGVNSRLYAHQRFTALTPTEVLAVISGYHRIYSDADPTVLRLVDEVRAHGNFRAWARFTHHVDRLCTRTGLPRCDEPGTGSCGSWPRLIPE
jgi:hypothetical protein